MRLPEQVGSPRPDTTPVVRTVGTAPVALYGPGPAGSAVLVVNRSLTVTVYVGGATDGTNGIPVAPLGSVGLYADQELYAVTDPSAATTAQVWVLPGGTSYSPSPAETAAQIALQSINVNGVSGSAGTPTSGPTGASRDVSANASASASTNAAGVPQTTSTVTLIAAPAVGALELHTLTLGYTIPGASGGTVQIIDTTTGAIIAQLPTASTATTDSITHDLKGARVTAGHGVSLKVVANPNSSVTGWANLAYNTVS